MRAAVVNAILIILGSSFGIVFRKRLSDKYKNIIFAAAGIIGFSIGISMVIQTKNILVFSLSIMLGGITGTFFGIENKIETLGEFIKKLFSIKDGEDNFANGFLTASVLFCSGAMAIVGSFKAGTVSDYSLIYTKSVMDGFISILIASAYGSGVLFSALSVLLYQGLLTLFSLPLSPYVSDALLSDITGSGGAMLLMIGFNLLGITKIKTGDFLPALIFTCIFFYILPYIPFL